jgi:5-methylcytosine-specific restriction endonuclease McrA
MSMVDPNRRKPPTVDSFTARPRRYSRTKRKTSEQRKDRENRDAEYNVTSDIFKEENPECAYCDTPMAPNQLQTDHICSGTGGRAATLLNAETWNNSCPTCHDKNPTIERKVLAKLLHVIKAVARGRSKNLSKQQRAFVLSELKKAKW